MDNRIEPSMEKARLIARIAQEKKGENIVVMDMRKFSAMYDCFVVVTASSSRRISTISNTIRKNLSMLKMKPLYFNGKRGPNWDVLDYEDVIVHVFLQEARDQYGLEELWSDAPVEHLYDNAK